MKNYRRKQYRESLDDNHSFVFYTSRQQTRYKQINYERIPYQVETIIDIYRYDYDTLVNRDARLQAINYECTLRDYFSKNQRKLMTPKLRKRIMERDNYTCQECGKHMPDEVGLHIDHIIPVSKGGKTVESNLQVLCSKCNRKKSNKLDIF